jgi:putative tricarboxylic transport membrane protein
MQATIGVSRMKDKAAGGILSVRAVLARWNAQTVIATAAILFGIFLYLIIPYEVGQQRFAFGMPISDLDPALFPTLIAIAFLVVGAWYFFASFGMPSANGLRELNSRAWLNISICILLSLAYAFLLVPLGFLVSSAAIIAITAVFYGGRNIVGLAIVSIGVPVFLYIIFTKYLLVGLPAFPEF